MAPNQISSALIRVSVTIVHRIQELFIRETQIIDKSKDLFENVDIYDILFCLFDNAGQKSLFHNLS